MAGLKISLVTFLVIGSCYGMYVKPRNSDDNLLDDHQFGVTQNIEGETHEATVIPVAGEAKAVTKVDEFATEIPATVQEFAVENATTQAQKIQTIVVTRIVTPETTTATAIITPKTTTGIATEKYAVENITPETTTMIVTPETTTRILTPKTTTSIVTKRISIETVTPQTTTSIIYPKTTTRIRVIYPETTTGIITPKTTTRILTEGTTTVTELRLAEGEQEETVTKAGISDKNVEAKHGVLVAPLHTENEEFKAV